MRKKQAFTLIELLVVLALIGLFAGLSFQQFSLLRFHVRNELNLLYQACIYMQRRALVTRQQQSLNLNLTDQSYRFNERYHKLPKGVRFDVMPVKGPPASPHKTLERACTFKNDQITFYPDGIIDAGSLYITNDKRTMLYALTVAVSTYSYLRTYCYADSWHLLK